MTFSGCRFCGENVPPGRTCLCEDRDHERRLQEEQEWENSMEYGEPPVLVYEFPLTKDFATAGLFCALARCERNTYSICNDPMNGCPEDFREDGDHALRSITCELYRRAQETKEKEVFEFACDLLERWMP